MSAATVVSVVADEPASATAALAEWADGLVVVARAAGVNVDGLSAAEVTARTLHAMRTDRQPLDTFLHWGLR